MELDSFGLKVPFFMGNLSSPVTAKFKNTKRLQGGSSFEDSQN